MEATEIFALTAVTCSSFASAQNCGDNCKVSVSFRLKRCIFSFRGTAFPHHGFIADRGSALGRCLPAYLQHSAQCLLLAWFAVHWGLLKQDLSYFHVAVQTEPLGSTPNTACPAVHTGSLGGKEQQKARGVMACDSSQHPCRLKILKSLWWWMQICCLSLNRVRSVSTKMLKHSLAWSHFYHGIAQCCCEMKKLCAQTSPNRLICAEACWICNF